MSYGFTSFLASYGVYLFMFFGINFGLSFIGAAMAKKKGYSYGGFLCFGMFTAFWISIIVASRRIPKSGSRYLVQRDMEQYFAQRNLHAQPNQQQPMAQNVQPPAQNDFLCKGCGAAVASGMAFCPSCGLKDPGKPTAW